MLTTETPAGPEILDSQANLVPQESRANQENRVHRAIRARVPPRAIPDRKEHPATADQRDHQAHQATRATSASADDQARKESRAPPEIPGGQDSEDRLAQLDRQERMRRTAPARAAPPSDHSVRPLFVCTRKRRIEKYVDIALHIMLLLYAFLDSSVNCVK
jgi:hypothetical protein